jgi:hypothetical protein
VVLEVTDRRPIHREAAKRPRLACQRHVSRLASRNPKNKNVRGGSKS